MENNGFLLLVLAVLNLFVVLYLSLKEWRYVRSWRALPVAPTMPLGGAPLVSVLVPARNEEKTIGPALASLQKQTYPDLEILVIDDQSQDATAAVVERLASQDSRIKLIRGTPLPEGWVGKCHALSQGLAQAKGAWLLFTDADVVHAPESVSSAMTHALNHRGDLFTLKFKKICLGFWEKVGVPYVYFVKGWFAPTPGQILDPLYPRATATGDFILFKRSFYESFGGHAHPEVRSYVVEDAAIARVAKRAGGKIETLDAQHLISVRKFGSLRELWFGFGKIIFAEYCNSSVFRLLIVQCLSIALYSIAPIFWLVFAVCFKGGILLGAIAGLMLAAALASAFAYHRQEGQPLWWSLLHPVGAVLLIGICLHSGYQAKFKKGIHWRNRHYQPKEEWAGLEGKS